MIDVKGRNEDTVPAAAAAAATAAAEAAVADTATATAFLLMKLVVSPIEAASDAPFAAGLVVT